MRASQLVSLSLPRIPHVSRWVLHFPLFSFIILLLHDFYIHSLSFFSLKSNFLLSSFLHPSLSFIIFTSSHFFFILVLYFLEVSVAENLQHIYSFNFFIFLPKNLIPSNYYLTTCIQIRSHMFPQISNCKYQDSWNFLYPKPHFSPYTVGHTYTQSFFKIPSYKDSLP